MKNLIALFVLMSLLVGNVWASGSYDFTVMLQGDAKSDVIHARLKYGDIDPGKEIAKAYIAKKALGAHPDMKSVQVVDYQRGVYPERPEVDEYTVSLTWNDMQELANTLGRGDVPGFAASVASIAVGFSIDVGKGAAEFVKDPAARTGEVLEQGRKGAEDLKDGVNRAFGTHF